MAKPSARSSLTLSSYLEITRGGAFSAVMVIALLAIYEVGIMATGSLSRNAADLALKEGLVALSSRGPMWFHLSLTVIFAAALLHLSQKKKGLSGAVLPFLGECSLYAMILAPAVLVMQEPFLAKTNSSNELILDLGAGVYEELVFRMVVIRGLFFVTGLENRRKLASGLGQGILLALILVASSLLFSAYHHWGPQAEAFEPAIFAFRALAGLILASLYLTRGLAVAVYTHALYDVFVYFSGA